MRNDWWNRIERRNGSRRTKVRCFSKEVSCSESMAGRESAGRISWASECCTIPRVHRKTIQSSFFLIPNLEEKTLIIDILWRQKHFWNQEQVHCTSPVSCHTLKKSSEKKKWTSLNIFEYLDFFGLVHLSFSREDSRTLKRKCCQQLSLKKKLNV